jgi:hypothetical protein
VVEELSWRYGCGRGRDSGPSCVLLHPGSTTHARIPVGFAFKFAPTCWTPQQKYHPPKNKFPDFIHHPELIIDSSTTVACNMSDTYSEVEERTQQAVDEMQALEPTPGLQISHDNTMFPIIVLRRVCFMELVQNPILFKGIADFRR